MRILIRGGRVMDPFSGRDELADVAISAGRVVRVGPAPAGRVGPRTPLAGLGPSMSGPPPEAGENPLFTWA